MKNSIFTLLLLLLHAATFAQNTEEVIDCARLSSAYADSVEIALTAEEPVDNFSASLQPEISYHHTGWWYDEGGDDRKLANTIRPFADDLEEALATDFIVIPFIGDGNLTVESSIEDWKERFRNKGRLLQDVSREKVPVVILADEPVEFSVEQLEQLIDIAKEVMNPDLEYTFSFTRKHIHPYKNPLPQNTTIIWWNHYPFRGENYPNPYPHVVTEQDFYEGFEETLRIARELSAPGTKFYVTSQTFAKKHKQFEKFGWQWRTPPAESPLWYARFISRHEDMAGALHFVYDGKQKYEAGAKQMPKLLENVQEVFEEVAKGFSRSQ